MPQQEKSYFSYTKARDAGWTHEDIETYVGEQQSNGVPLYIKNNEYQAYESIKGGQDGLREKLQKSNDDGFWNSFGKASERTMDWMNNSVLSPMMREIERPFVSVYRGATGTTGAVKTPFGDVKPYAELSSGESASGAFEMGSTVFPVGRVAGTMAKPFKWAGRAVKSKLLPKAGAYSSEKMASFLSNVPEDVFKYIKKEPGMVKAGKEFLESDGLVDFGEEIFKTAKKVRTSGMESYGRAEKVIMDDIGGFFKQGSRALAKSVDDVLAEEGIKKVKKGLDLMGSTFEGDGTAKRIFNSISDISSKPAESIGALLNKRKSIGNIIKKLPKESRNLQRVADKMMEAYDNQLDNITDGAFTTLKKKYKATSGNALDVIKGMSDKYGQFDADKSASYVKQLYSGLKFNKKTAVEILDKAAGSQFANRAKGIGAAKAISRIDPITAGRALDVIKVYGISKVPLASALVSPKFWGETFLRKAGINLAKESQEGLLKNLFKSAGIKTPGGQLFWQNAIKAFFEDEEF